MSESDFDLSRLDRIPDPLAGAPPSALPAASVPSGASPTRTDLRRGRRLALLVGATWLLVELAVSGLRPDLAQVPLGYQLAFVLVPIVAGLTCFATALSSGRLGLGPRVALLATLTLSLPAAYVAAGFLLSPAHPNAISSDFRHGAACFALALGWTLLPLIAAGLALRRSFVTAPAWRSALVGAGAGLVVSATSTLRCPISGAFHVSLGHGGAVIATALVGAWLLARATRV